VEESAASCQLPLLSGLDGLLNGHISPGRLERALAAEWVGPVVGVDEAGRGPLAGPVVAAAVVFRGPCAVRGVDDSKRLTPEARGRLAPRIRRAALAWAVGTASAEEIDQVNILEATRLAAVRAIAALGLTPAVILSDALSLPRLSCPVVPIVRGDARVKVIGAASILAKVHRDRLMRRLSREWPQYGFNLHFGYPTGFHRLQLERHGPSTIHRLSFEGVTDGPGQPLVRSRFFHAMEGALSNGTEAGAIAAWRWRLLRRRPIFPARECQELLRRCAAL
jgi:ribonuclease HII